MASAGPMVEAYEKTSDKCVESSYPSVVRFAGHVQLKGVRPRTVEAYAMMVRLLARWAGRDPAELEEERVRRAVGQAVDVDAREVGNRAKAFQYAARNDPDAPWRLRGGAPARWAVRLPPIPRFGCAKDRVGRLPDHGDG